MTKKFNEEVNKVLRNPEPLFDNFVQQIWKRYENYEKDRGKKITIPREVVDTAKRIVEENLKDMRIGDKLALHEELMKSRGPESRGVSIMVVRYRWDGQPDYLAKWLKRELASKAMMRYIPHYI